jgi:hypothetical protein
VDVLPGFGGAASDDIAPAAARASARAARRPELLDELATVRLRESTPGVCRLHHDASGHDDRAEALGLAALALTESHRGGSVTVPRSAPVERTMTDGRPALPTRLAVRASADAMPRGLPGGAILGVPEQRRPTSAGVGGGLAVAWVSVWR